MLNELSDHIQKSIAHLKAKFSALQVGRANPSLVENIQVESYGTVMALKASANISCPDAKTIRIEPWDKNLIGEIEKALQAANLGINPQNMGDNLLLPIPPLTEERRKECGKQVHEITESAHIAVRNARQDAFKQIKTQKDNKEISEDEAKKLEKQAQERVDEGNKEIDMFSKEKEKEVMTP